MLYSLTKYWLRQWVLVLLVCGLAAPAWGTHIVGGEFSLVYVRQSQYDLTLTLYFDAINGSAGALDTDVRCFIFPKGGPNAGLPSATVIMSLTPDLVYVNYSNPSCEFVRGAVRTRVLTYERRLTLNPVEYQNPGGYYIVWERCCRNGAISNIINPGATGQAFYLEFPPIRTGRSGGDTLKNSSPTLFKPLSDFACVGKGFTFDFSGQDPDGDRLVYALVPPFAGNATSLNPGQYPQSPAPPLAGPYREVAWAPGYTNRVQINGPVPLQINAVTGLLSMLPDRVGLFVFAIECSEFRGSRYLGKVRREFQIFIQNCEPNTNPKILLKNSLAGPNLRNGDTLTVFLEPNGGCKPLSIGDSIPDDVTLTATSPDLPAGSVTLSVRNGTTSAGPVSTLLCVSPCVAVQATRYARLYLSAVDNACSIPNKDSLFLILALVPKVPAPRILGRNGYNMLGDTITPVTTLVQILAADSTWPTTTKVYTVPPNQAALTLLPGAGTDRRRLFSVQLEPSCGGDTVQQFKLFMVTTVNRCSILFSDTISMPFTILRRPHAVIITLQDSTGALLQNGTEIALLPGSYLHLTATATLSEPGPVTLETQTPYRPLLAAGQPRTGASPLQQVLRWSPTCADLKALQPGTALQVQFIATAAGCEGTQSAPVALTIRLRDTSRDTINLTNIITLNKDERNAAFKLYAPLPVPNCAGGFEGVTIYSRWGRKVFESELIDFAWRPDSDASALYFYKLAFRGKVYKGWLEATGN